MTGNAAINVQKDCEGEVSGNIPLTAEVDISATGSLVLFGVGATAQAGGKAGITSSLSARKDGLYITGEWFANGHASATVHLALVEVTLSTEGFREGDKFWNDKKLVGW